MLVIIVMPCLNEEARLSETCQSLGFGKGGSAPTDSILILVNNNSTDDTQRVAERISESSQAGSVYTSFEPEVGYVPARRNGNNIAIKIAKEKNLNPDNIFILQVDADTRYEDGYIDSMRNAALSHERNILFEARSKYPKYFEDDYGAYIKLCQGTDEEIDFLLAEVENDYIVDDKVAGYWLTDYLNWGEHRREFTTDGEIYAETTRLFLKAQCKGAKRLWVEAATAYHSPRKIIHDYLFHFVTSGFPRDRTWNGNWKKTNEDRECCLPRDKPIPQPERVNLDCRMLHSIAIFYILPFHIERAIHGLSDDNLSEIDGFLCSNLPMRNGSDLLREPAIFLTDIFELIDSKGEEVLRAVGQDKLRNTNDFQC